MKAGGKLETRIRYSRDLRLCFEKYNGILARFGEILYNCLRI